jgi:beta-N-acetylhexosaminidase
VLASLTPEQRVDQLFITGFNGAEVTPELREFIDAHQLGGVFLSRETCNIDNGTLHDPEHCGFPDDANPDTPAQVATLTNELQKAACDATTGSVDGAPFCLPLFVSIDHEGDDRPSTRLLNRFTPIPSDMAIGATFDPAQAEKVGCIVGQELSAVGVNMLFGPDLDVLDMPRSGGAGDQGIRVFGGDARWVAEMGAAYVRGVQECGGGQIATVAKHFPGHGRSTRSVDYEDVPVVVGKTLDMLAQVDLLPFTSVAQGSPGDKGSADGIMISHLSYPEVAGCEAGTPVGFSTTCMQSFFSLPALAAWRQAGGVTVADDLASGAVQAYAQEKFHTYPQGDLALEALMAGNDVLPLIRPWQWQDLQATVDYLIGRYEADPAVKARIDDAARRVITLKSRLYGGLDPAAVTKMSDYTGKVGLSQSYSDVTSIAESAITLIKPATSQELTKQMPVPNAGDRILFVECWDDPACTTTSDPGYPPLWPRGKLADLVGQMFPGRIAKEDMSTISFSDLGNVLSGKGDGVIRQAVDDADWLVFGFLELDPNYPASGVLKDFLGRGPTLFDMRSKKVVVFAYNSPYHLDAGELRNVDLFVAAYSKIEPSLRASLKVLFQDPTILRDDSNSGKLPVDYIYEGYVVNDLSESVKADPAQSLALTVEPPQPVAGEEATFRLESPLLAKNGHRVPNGTKVDFVFQPPDGTPQDIPAVTSDGVATVKANFTQAGKTQLTVKSDDLAWSPAEPLDVRASAGSSGSSSMRFVLPLALSLSLLVVAGLGAGGFVAVRTRRRRVAVAVAVPEAIPVGGGGPALEGKPIAERELYVNTSTQQVFVRGKEVQPPLSREQYALLAFLFDNAGKLCLRDDIINRAWPDALGGVSDEAVDALVHRVRERLRAAGASKLFIVTIRGRGFRLDL